MIFTIAGKELKSLFASPLAWVVLTVMQLILGYVFLRRLDDFLQLQSQLSRLANPPGASELVAAPVFGTAAGVLLFAVPLLAMRLVAEERRNQTMALLLSGDGDFDVDDAVNQVTELSFAVMGLPHRPAQPGREAGT